MLKILAKAVGGAAKGTAKAGVGTAKVGVGTTKVAAKAVLPPANTAYNSVFHGPGLGGGAGLGAPNTAAAAAAGTVPPTSAGKLPG